MEKPPTRCPTCDAPLVHKDGVNEDTGKHWEFWGCSNYPNCTYKWWPPRKETKKTKKKAPTKMGEYQVFKELEKIEDSLKILNENDRKILKKINDIKK